MFGRARDWLMEGFYEERCARGKHRWTSRVVGWSHGVLVSVITVELACRDCPETRTADRTLMGRYW